MKIVVDAMGGDHAPQAVIAGVVDALKEFDVTIVLVGRTPDVEAELKKYQYPRDKVELIHADEVVGMDEPATNVIRKKRNSSITVGVNLLKDPQYHAFISAGNTGAVVAASTINLGMIPGVERPAIGLTIPTLKGFSFLIDVGANTDPKPQHLLQNAQMAAVYAREVLGLENPSVGLLNIGEESTKGTDFVKEIHKLLSEKVKNFTGNTEANEVYAGKSDCIICDGFVGNIVLKVSEGLMESVGALMKREIKKSPIAIFGAFLVKSKLADAKKKIDYSEYGGAPLLGVNGIVMISHGRSNPKAIKNAIRATMREVEHDIIKAMQKEISSAV
ncbi:MAG: phosphate acyltransferase PlsX [Candidatus Omnitrophica bacterium]|nr:phosphate acyltransferase PlsX [Candidatus Omnitrophota bacterium]